MKQDTPYLSAVKEIFRTISRNLPNNLEVKVCAYLAGGAAIHYWTQHRVSLDVDTIFSHKIIIPQGLQIIFDDDKIKRTVFFDYNYNPEFGLLHPDYPNRAIPFSIDPIDPIDRASDYFKVYVLSPIDLAITKLSRFQMRDQQDILALIQKNLLHDIHTFNQLAQEALAYFIGNTAFIAHNIKIVQDKICESAKS